MLFLFSNTPDQLQGRDPLSRHAGAIPAGDVAGLAVKDIPPDSDAEPSGASNGDESMSEDEEEGQVQHPGRICHHTAVSALPAHVLLTSVLATSGCPAQRTLRPSRHVHP